HFPLLPVDVAGAQVTDPARPQLAHARMADPFAAAERELEPGLLACHEDRRVPVGLGLAVRLQEVDRTALALAVLPQTQLRLEALHTQAVAVAVAIPVLAERVEHVGRPGNEGPPLAPVRA